MFDVQFYNINKKNNSTLLPGTPAITMSCQANEAFDILHPQLKINSSLSSPPSYNYCHIASLNRYFWISKWECRNGLWYASCDCDYLASWKTQIGASEQYVLRSASKWNPDIIDNMYPCEAGEKNIIAPLPLTIWSSIGSMLYCVGIIGADGIDYYTTRHESFNKFIEYILSDAYANQALENLTIVDPSLKVALNPLQYITAVTVWPIDYPSGQLGSVKVSSIKVGTVDVGVNGLQFFKLSDYVAHIEDTFDFDPHPNYVDGINNYLNFSPYTTYSIYAPPFGIIDFEPSKDYTQTVEYTIYLDVRTGSATLNIGVGGSEIPGGAVQHTITANIGVPIKLTSTITPGYGLTQAIRDVSGVIGGIGTAALGLATGNVVAGASGIFGTIGSGVSALGNYANGKVPKLSSTGTVGSLDWTGYGGWEFIESFKIPVDQDPADLGRPLCERLAINELSGYVLVDNPHITIAGLPEEKSAIEGFMASGFFYE